MNNLTSSQRKLVYFVGIAILAVPIVFLGRPAAEGGQGGGMIAQSRQKYRLGEVSFGEVDPASATMNLVLLGLRGVAANLLWMEADELKEKKRWSELNSTVESIIRLQPHFQSVWKFQAWNLSYNVSAECDAVEDRYFWVKKGIKFLERGVARNERVPEMRHDLGDFYGKKLGRSDERREFREFFLVDPDTERWEGGPDTEINPDRLDNYLVAKQKYEAANEVYRLPGVEQHKMGEPLFVMYPYRSQMDYASARQDENKFGDVTREAWAESYRGWTQEYGQTDFPTPGGVIRFEWTHDELERKGEEEGYSLDFKIYWQGRYEDMVNYRYWKLRASVERTPELAAARKAFADGRVQFREEQDMFAARDTFYDGLEKLQTVIDNPEYRREDGSSRLLSDEADLVEDALKAIIIWRHILQDVLGQPIPDEFPMDEVWVDPQYEGLRASLLEEFQRWQGSGI
ncbi:MAG: hypothetical protein DWQ34_08275 [Planctomycetota bacterium]|nr:MAG: hypothetical protein DWQ29_06405 [Planctomycetota bacterium]REJ94719.1 MAG: hypothetical protein DWQ34_08275 [Planctomycetota bacterium]REK31319.1 MAG: hypothetical protein DWQ41_00255 [Planctomycetota bacterium]REK39044.1 MAG: hypothetical protein DWQ45_02295 [Planctomycetota bacterium]